MSEYQFPNHVMERFARHLRQEERSPGTVAKYLRDVSALCPLAGQRPGDKGTGHRVEGASAHPGVRSHYHQLHAGCHQRPVPLPGWDECRVKFLKVQRRLFRTRDGS